MHSWLCHGTSRVEGPDLSDSVPFLICRGRGALCSRISTRENRNVKHRVSFSRKSITCFRPRTLGMEVANILSVLGLSVGPGHTKPPQAGSEAANSLGDLCVMAKELPSQVDNSPDK